MLRIFTFLNIYFEKTFFFEKGMLVFVLVMFFYNVNAQKAITNINASYVNVTNAATNYQINGNGSHGNYSSGTNYNLEFGRIDNAQNNYELSKTASFVADGKTYDAAFLVDKFFVRRNGTANGTVSGNKKRQILWFEKESSGNSGANRRLRPTYAGSIEESFRSLRLNIGSDNTFVNYTGSGSAQVNNIERFDYINSEGISTSTPQNAGFAVFERNGNDPFKIAAVLSIDENGNPLTFGALKQIANNAYGSYSVHNTEYVIFQKQDNDTFLKPAEDGGPQKISGVFISLSDLGVAANKVFYGYVILPNDAISTDYTKNPTNTNSSDGGMDAYPGGGFYDSDGGLQQVNANSDIDNDGVPNTSDLDDDNDGIPDIDEGLNCGTSNLKGNKTSNVNYGKDALTAIAEYESVSVDVTSTVSNSNDSKPFRFENNIAGNAEGLLLNTTNTNFDIAPSTHTFQFNQAITNLEIDLGDIDENDIIEVKAFNGVNRLKLSASNFIIPATNITYDGAATVYANSKSVAKTASTNNVTLRIGIPIDKLIFRVGKNVTTSNLEVSFSNIKYCIATDTDQDGVFDYLDLDSDNDGIYDAVEAGHGVAHYKGRLSGAVGNDGIADALQDSANAGTINYTILNSFLSTKQDYINIDSDNDGCSDVLEAGFTQNAYKPGTLSGNTINKEGTIGGNIDGYTIPQDLNANNFYDYRENTPTPIITMQPNSKTAFAGDTTSFEVTGTDIDNYQWQVFNGADWIDLVNGSVYSGVHTKKLNVKVNSKINKTYYRVLVTNTTSVCGDLISDEVVLSVKTKTVITNRNLTYRVNN
ncbi:hypothetical protein JM658_04600 [Joostella atrarenae]|uniref:Uncharacterized protein n=1 Tax=Joostella atrarenae TaxID=679257 RepID=A0ABS9J0Y5_9FLAO|nr:hypothetical protein [Joostella atrarenae]MCF8714101.1 hypothetical protein [Joostella atrarenae]